MDDAHAHLALGSTVVDEVREAWLGFFERHTVQVDFGLDTVAAALQLAHGAAADVRAMEAQGGAVAMLDRVDIVLEALGKHLLFIGFRELRPGLWLRLRCRRALLRLQRLGALHCAPELFYVFLVHTRYSVRVVLTYQDPARN